MTTLTSKVASDYLDIYDGYDSEKVGIGLNTGYATKSYREKKIQNLMIGAVSDISYSGWEHDREPLIIPIISEASRYNTILAFNLRYVPSNIRRAILKYILEANAARIRARQPLMIDYHALKRAIPQVRGIVRRYKLPGIRVVETYPLNEWASLVNIQSPHERMYRTVVR